MIGLHSSRVFKGVSCCRRQHIYWGSTRLIDLQQTYGLGLQKKKKVQLQLTLMAAATIFDNTFIAGLAAEKYFAVNLQLLGCKKYITNT